jgi:hypothetical protein
MREECEEEEVIIIVVIFLPYYAKVKNNSHHLSKEDFNQIARIVTMYNP